MTEKDELLKKMSDLYEAIQDVEDVKTILFLYKQFDATIEALKALRKGDGRDG